MKKLFLLGSLTLAVFASNAYSQNIKMCRKKIASTFVMLPCGTTTTVQSPAQCAQVWVGGNFDNATFSIANNQKHGDLSSNKYATRTWHGGFRQSWSGTDRYWRDISSARVAAGCRLTVFSAENFTSPAGILTGTSTPQDFPSSVFPGPGSVGSVSCTCDGDLSSIPGTGSDGFSLVMLPAPTK